MGRRGRPFWGEEVIRPNYTQEVMQLHIDVDDVGGEDDDHEDEDDDEGEVEGVLGGR